MRKDKNIDSKVIAIDCDEILCDTVGYFLNYTDFFGSDTCYDDLTLDDLSAMYAYNHENFQQIVLSSSNIFDEMVPITGAVEALEKFKNAGYTLYIITGRTENMKQFTFERVDYHFPGMISDIFFCNNYGSKSVEKQEYCRKVHSSLMIDDDPRFIDNVRHIPVYMINRPWNKNFSTDNAIKFGEWNALVDTVLSA